MELASQLEQVKRYSMRLERLRRRRHHGWKSNRAPHQIEFLSAERIEIHLRRIGRQAEASLFALAKNTCQTRVRILDVKNRILGRLLLGQLEIEIKLTVRLAKQKEKSHHVNADFLDKLVESHVGRLAGGHLDLLAGARERDELVDDYANRPSVVAERLYRGDHLLMLPDMVRAEHVDDQIESAFQFLYMIRDVGGAISWLPIRTRAHQHRLFRT